MPGAAAVKQLDWRIWLGLGLTFSWLLAALIYISVMGWALFLNLPPDQIGSFLEGAFAPLAFLWLVIGFFLQHKELQQNTAALQAQFREIERSTEQAVIQSGKMAESEVHARQNTFLMIAQNVQRQLGSIIGLLFVSSQGGGGNGTIDDEEMGRLFTALGQNDPEVFSRKMLTLHLSLQDEEEKYALFYGTPVRARHTNNFIYTFERLMERAGEVDEYQMIRDSLASSAHGFIYRLAKIHQANAPEELSDHTKTGTDIRVGT